METALRLVAFYINRLIFVSLLLLTAAALWRIDLHHSAAAAVLNHFVCAQWHYSIINNNAQRADRKMPFSASCRPVFVLSNGVLTFVVCHVVDFCDFFKVGQICIERVPLHGFLPVSRTPRHAYRCAASLAGFPLACQSCLILRSLSVSAASGRVFHQTVCSNP